MHLIAIRYGAVTRQGLLSLALLKNPGEKTGRGKSYSSEKGVKR